MNEAISAPLSCSACAIGIHTVYGPTFQKKPDTLTALRRQIRTYEANKFIARAGEPLGFHATVFAGWAQRCDSHASGRQQIFGFALPGDALSPESLYHPSLALPYSLKSVTQLVLCTFDIGDMRQLLHEDPEQRSALDKLFQDYTASTYRRLASLGCSSAEARIANLIMDLHRRLKRMNLVSAEEFYFPLRLEHIAQASGMTSVHASRSLSKLRARGIIAHGERRMKIIDREALRTIADDG
jgi:CRP-like cAMP-binding protein